MGTHVHLWEFTRDVPHALFASQHRDDLDLALFEAPFSEHVKSCDGGSPGSDQCWMSVGVADGGITRRSGVTREALYSRSRRKTRSAVTSVGSLE